MDIFTVQQPDRDTLKRALKRGEKVGKAATTTCRHAELTQGEDEAQKLEGYCTENLMHLENASGTELELSTGGAMAAATALRIYGGEIEKKKASLQEALGLEEDTEIIECDEALERIARLLRQFRRVNDPELELQDA